MSKALIEDIIAQMDTNDTKKTSHDNDSFRGNYVIGKNMCAPD